MNQCHDRLDHPHTPYVRARALRFAVDQDAIWEGILDPAPIVRRAVAAHPDATPEQLRQLACDEDALTRAIATINRNAPVDVVRRGLAPDAPPAVRFAACEAARRMLRERSNNDAVVA